MSDLRHYDNTGACRFITFSTYRRLPLLRDNRASEIVVEEMREWRRTTNAKILGYVIMPEHIHLLLLPPDEWRPGPEIGKLKSKAASRLVQDMPNGLAFYLDQLEIVKDHRRRLAIWTPRCFDRICRDEDSVRTRLDYCHANPVRRGLVTSPCDWVWSSYGWYQGIKNVPLVIDEF